MSLAKRKRSKYPNFVAVGKDMLYDPEWQKLSPSAKIAYLYLKAGYNRSNNGSIKVPYASLQAVVGLRSSSTIAAALQDLEKDGWIRRAKPGGLFRLPNLYHLTGKYDACL